MSASSLTSKIEEYIEQLLEENGSGAISLRRKDLAELFECVPSQINYVLRSKFAPENGFLVESQRGGHGYIRVVQLTFKNCDEEVTHIQDLIGSRTSEQESKRLLMNLQNRKLLSARERLLIEVALRSQDENGRALFDVSIHTREIMRAALLKKLLTSLALS
ncbi:CtsR family transcriptional regulator [Synergistes jonesii]|uniref:CtsR family transcriptional regulator n=1 Tax=Synergistes jonesii TaxID=2754 RepID=UPI002430D713|nr:CtsR family transcriptional regulator [Synergistes jonesii]